jgi:hypothetical protein
VPRDGFPAARAMFQRKAKIYRKGGRSVRLWPKIR